MTDSPWLTRDELAERLRVPVSTVVTWAKHNRGPAYGKFGRHIRYHIDAVKAWEQEQVRGQAS